MPDLGPAAGALIEVFGPLVGPLLRAAGRAVFGSLVGSTLVGGATAVGAYLLGR